MKPSALLRHSKMRDVAFTITRTITTTPTRTTLLVEWYNIGKRHQPWNMNLSQVITVSKEFLSELKSYNKEAHENENYHTHFTPGN